MRGQGEEVRGQGEEVRGQGEEMRGQGEDVRGQGEEVRGQGEDVRGQGEEVRGQGEGMKRESTKYADLHDKGAKKGHMESKNKESGDMEEDRRYTHKEKEVPIRAHDVWGGGNLTRHVVSGTRGGDK